MTRVNVLPSLVSALTVLCLSSVALAQGMGGFGGQPGPPGPGAAARWLPDSEAPVMPTDRALSFISVVGTAELLVEPEGIRVVFAITSEAETAQACQEKNAARVQALVKAWTALSIPEKDVVEDFINVLPVYEWRLVERDGEEFRVQQQKGFRMQSNLHLAVKTEQEAMAAIKAAFGQGVTEIVTFDYWSSQLNGAKAKALDAALSAAKEKAKVLLVVFDAPPKVINIQESTQAFFPRSLYSTYTNVLEEEAKDADSWRNKPSIKAYRPKMTFYSGLDSRTDAGPTTPAMRPKISVVSSVRIYYQSPADKAAPPGIRASGW